MIRSVLAATLSSVYGIYSGFELCENAALPGREEYLDSEKYQFKERDWDAPGNIKDWITRMNRIRSENRALHLYDNLRFYRADNDAILCYAKMTRGARQHHPGRRESRSEPLAKLLCSHPAGRFRPDGRGCLPGARPSDRCRVTCGAANEITSN